MAQRSVPAGARFAYEVGADALREQLDRIAALDSKAGVLIAANGIVAGVLFGRASFLFRAPRPVSVSAIVLVFASLLLALIAFLHRRYRVAPNPDAVMRLMTASEDWLRWRFLGNLREAIVGNDAKLRNKARAVAIALTLLMLAVGILGGYLVYALIKGWEAIG